MDITNSIKKHITYKSADDVAEICKPLFDTFGLRLFNYTRIYPDESILALVSHRGGFYYNITKKYPVSTMRVNTGIYPWESYVPREFIKELAEHFELYNGLTICRHYKDFKETINIATSPYNYEMVNLCCNQTELFNQFLFYFKDKTAKLIEQAYKERFVVPKNMRGETPSEQSYVDFCSLIKTNRIRMNFKSKEIILSRREYECLLYLARGKSIKEVANVLNISPRTVEEHLAHAKNKTNCFSKSRLLDLFYKNLVFVNSKDGH